MARQGFWLDVFSDIVATSSDNQIVLVDRHSSMGRRPFAENPEIRLERVTLRLLRRLAVHPCVRGVLLTGSSARGLADEWSDDDLEVILSAATLARMGRSERKRAFAVRGEQRSRIICDVVLTDLDDLRERASSPRDGEHWPYERCVVLHARTPEVGRAVAALRRMEPAFAGARVRHALLDVILAAERAAASRRRGADEACWLITIRGVRALARLLFALEGRWVPLDHWLPREVRTLDDPAACAGLLLAALRSGRPDPLTAALDRLVPHLAARGLPVPTQRRELAAVLLHPSRRAERYVHGLC